MGFIVGFFAKLIKIFLYFLIFLAFIVLIPNLPPYTKFTRIELAPTLPREGPLALNDALNNAQKLYENKLLSPEAFQLYDGEVYTTLATGEIVKLSPGDHVTFVTKIGQPCNGLIQEHICGRPLGFKIDEKNKQLYVADSYHGIWKVDLKTDKKQLLVSPNVEVKGCKPKFFNDLVLDKEGNLYYTVSSCDFQLRDGSFTSLVDPSGRLLRYNAAKNDSTLLLDNLWVPNGVTISPENDYLLVSESFGYKVVKYYIRGPQKGQKGTLIEGLPGAPDNIRALPDESGVLLALYSSFDDKDPMVTRTLAGVPIVRKFLARMLRLIEIPFEFFNEQYPHIMFEEIVYYIGSFKSISGLAPATSGLLYIDWNGNVIASYYNTDRSVKHISDGFVYKDALYIGNPHDQNFIGKVPAPTILKQAFIPKKSVVKEEVKKSKVEYKTNTENVKEKEYIKEKQESKIESVKPMKPTTTIPKTTTTKPDEKIHTTPKPSEKTHTPTKSEEKIYTTPKAEEIKYTTQKPQEKQYTTPRPEERRKETTTNQNYAQAKEAESKPIIKKKQPDSQSGSPPKPSDPKPTVTPKPTERKLDDSKQTETKSTTQPKPEIKATVPPKQADDKPKTAKQTESNLKQSENKDTVKKGDKAAPPTPLKQDEPKSAEKKQTESKTTTSKPSESQSAPPKQADVKPKESVDKSKSNQKATPESEPKPAVKKENIKPVPEQIPVKEDIPSDTAKPLKETIKVIKKEGPTEIPNLSL